MDSELASQLTSELALAAAPPRLIQRDSERMAIVSFLNAFISGTMTRMLYVYGVPGIGKTALVQEVTQDMEIETLYINSMTLKNPRHFFRIVGRKVLDKVPSGRKAMDLVDLHFQKYTPHRKRLLIILDEIDYIATRDFVIIDKLFDWSRRSVSKLAVIAISNDINLLAEAVYPRIDPSLHPIELCLQPYKKDQIRAIIEERLSRIVDNIASVFQDGALQMISLQCQNSFGDIRSALHYATECVTAAKEFPISTKDTLLVRTSALQSSVVSVLSTYSTAALLFLTLSAVKSGGLIEETVSMFTSLLMSTPGAPPIAALPHISASLQSSMVGQGLIRLENDGTQYPNFSSHELFPELSLRSNNGDTLANLCLDLPFVKTFIDKHRVLL